MENIEGVHGKSFLKDALLKRKDPLKFIKLFQNENTIKLNSIQTALPFLDLHSIYYTEFSDSLIMSRIKELISGLMKPLELNIQSPEKSKSQKTNRLAVVNTKKKLKMINGCLKIVTTKVKDIIPSKIITNEKKPIHKSETVDQQITYNINHLKTLFKILEKIFPAILVPELKMIPYFIMENLPYLPNKYVHILLALYPKPSDFTTIHETVISPSKSAPKIKLKISQAKGQSKNKRGNLKIKSEIINESEPDKCKNIFDGIFDTYVPKIQDSLLDPEAKYKDATNCPYFQCPLGVKRHIWLRHYELFRRELKPIVKTFIHHYKDNYDIKAMFDQHFENLGLIEPMSQSFATLHLHFSNLLINPKDRHLNPTLMEIIKIIVPSTSTVQETGLDDKNLPLHAVPDQHHILQSIRLLPSFLNYCLFDGGYLKKGHIEYCTLLADTLSWIRDSNVRIVWNTQSLAYDIRKEFTSHNTSTTPNTVEKSGLSSPIWIDRLKKLIWCIEQAEKERYEYVTSVNTKIMSPNNTHTSNNNETNIKLSVDSHHIPTQDSNFYPVQEFFRGKRLVFPFYSYALIHVTTPNHIIYLMAIDTNINSTINSINTKSLDVNSGNNSTNFHENLLDHSQELWSLFLEMGIVKVINTDGGSTKEKGPTQKRAGRKLKEAKLDASDADFILEEENHNINGNISNNNNKRKGRLSDSDSITHNLPKNKKLKSEESSLTNDDGPCENSATNPKSYNVTFDINVFRMLYMLFRNPFFIDLCASTICKLIDFELHHSNLPRKNVKLGIFTAMLSFALDETTKTALSQTNSVLAKADDSQSDKKGITTPPSDSVTFYVSPQMTFTSNNNSFDVIFGDINRSITQQQEKRRIESLYPYQIMVHFIPALMEIRVREFLSCSGPGVVEQNNHGFTSSENLSHHDNKNDATLFSTDAGMDMSAKKAEKILLHFLLKMENPVAIKIAQYYTFQLISTFTHEWLLLIKKSKSSKNSKALFYPKNPGKLTKIFDNTLSAHENSNDPTFSFKEVTKAFKTLIDFNAKNPNSDCFDSLTFLILLQMLCKSMKSVKDNLFLHTLTMLLSELLSVCDAYHTNEHVLKDQDDFIIEFFRRIFDAYYYPNITRENIILSCYLLFGNSAYFQHLYHNNDSTVLYILQKMCPTEQHSKRVINAYNHFFVTKTAETLTDPDLL